MRHAQRQPDGEGAAVGAGQRAVGELAQPGAEVDLGPGGGGAGALLGVADDVPHQPDAVPHGAPGGRCRPPAAAGARPVSSWSPVERRGQGADGGDVLGVGRVAGPGGGHGALDQRRGGVEDAGQLRQLPDPAGGVAAAADDPVVGGVERGGERAAGVVGSRRCRPRSSRSAMRREDRGHRRPVGVERLGAGLHAGS